jgi:tetratricopeptide (TPR) repeat protein
MKQRRRRWRRIGIGAGLLALGWLAFVQLDTWRARGELRLAQQDLASGRLEAAHRRLTGLVSRSDELRGAASYWMGVCEALGGRQDAALVAFARVPEGYAFDPLGAYLEAKANMSRGRLRDAERRLEQARDRDGPGRDQVRELLSEIYEIEVRFDDVKSLHRAALAEADDPTRELKELSNLDLDRLPYDGLKGALEKAGQLGPQDDRVWLGKARLAIQAGRWDEAADWLKRCREAHPDPAVWRAWLDWARGSGRPAEAVEAARQLGPKGLDPEGRLELRAWIARQRGDAEAESAALDRWLELDPAATQALERLAALAHRAGRPDRVAELRRRKAEVERAMAAYRDRLWGEEPLRTAADRSALARLAEAAGRPHEARALYRWATRIDPDNNTARDGLARVDQGDTRRAAARPPGDDPWDEPASPIASRRASAGRTPGGVPAFTDDAGAAGLRFVYDNAETPLRQLPEPFGGGLALLDYDGDGWLDVYCVQGGPFA